MLGQAIINGPSYCEVMENGIGKRAKGMWMGPYMRSHLQIEYSESAQIFNIK